MSITSQEACQNVINQIKAHIHKELPAKESALLEPFAQRYFASCSIEDLRERPIQEWFAILYSHWKFIYERKKGELKIQVFNTDKARDGWQTPHTIIEISHDDIPFLVDSTRMIVKRYGYEIHFIIHFGGFKVKRDSKNRITEISTSNSIEKDFQTEAPIYIEIDYIADVEAIKQLTNEIMRALTDVQAAVSDWRKMVSLVEKSLEELEQNPPAVDAAELAESKDFLRWLNNNNFTFLGARDYKLIGNGTNRALQLIPNSGLGVLRDDLTPAASSKNYSELPPQARKMALSKNILIIAKTNTTSTIHREAYTDYIGVEAL